MTRICPTINYRMKSFYFGVEGEKLVTRRSGGKKFGSDKKKINKWTNQDGKRK